MGGDAVSDEEKVVLNVIQRGSDSWIGGNAAVYQILQANETYQRVVPSNLTHRHQDLGSNACRLLWCTQAVCTECLLPTSPPYST